MTAETLSDPIFQTATESRLDLTVLQIILPHDVITQLRRSCICFGES